MILVDDNESETKLLKISDDLEYNHNYIILCWLVFQTRNIQCVLKFPNIEQPTKDLSKYDKKIILDIHKSQIYKFTETIFLPILNCQNGSLVFVPNGGRPTVRIIKCGNQFYVKEKDQSRKLQTAFTDLLLKMKCFGTYVLINYNCSF